MTSRISQIFGFLQGRPVAPTGGSGDVPTTNGSTAPTPTLGTDQLQAAGRDPEVADLQAHLRALGYYSDNQDSGRLDGLTRAALNRFQFANGLPGTGMPDAATWQKLRAAVGQAAGPDDATADAATATATVPAAPATATPTANPADAIQDPSADPSDPSTDVSTVTDAATASTDAPDPAGATDAIDPADSSAPAPATAAAAPPAAAPAAGPGTYTVASGDSLSQIALAKLGDASRWTEIYDLNKDLVGADPNAIKPGQELKLPDGAAPAPVASATPAPTAAPAPAPAGAGPHSAITVDGNVQPRTHSTIPGYEKGVEQCGEFVYRYFKSQGKDYPTTGQPYNYLTGQVPAKPGFDKVMNGSTTPPKAGDILVAKGPGGGEYHTALITRVDGDKVHVLQANVPYNWQGGKDLEADFPLQFDGTHYTMPALRTSQKGYNHDYPVTGWIHPTGANKLPGAPD